MKLTKSQVISIIILNFLLYIGFAIFIFEPFSLLIKTAAIIIIYAIFITEEILFLPREGRKIMIPIYIVSMTACLILLLI